MNKIIWGIIKIKEAVERKLKSFFGVLFILEFIIITLEIKGIINISWILAIMPLIIMLIIIGAYLVLFFIDEIKYRKEIKGMRNNWK